MHEVSLIKNTLDIALKKAEEAAFKKINKVSLKVGVLTAVMPEAMNFAFKSITKGTIAEGSELIIENVEATGHCSKCNLSFPIDRFNKFCPKCSNFCNDIITGYELYINTLEGE